MKLKYDDSPEFEASSLTNLLYKYALGVLNEMQAIDKGMADCWTACVITFEDLNPDFTWGSIEDLECEKDKEGVIYVELPLDNT